MPLVSERLSRSHASWTASSASLREPLKAVILSASRLHDPDAVVGHAVHRALQIFAIIFNDIKPLQDEGLIGLAQVLQLFWISHLVLLL
jgi:hypothetical protein